MWQASHHCQMGPALFWDWFATQCKGLAVLLIVFLWLCLGARQQCQKISNNMTTHTHTHTTFLLPFFRDPPGEPVPEENLWTLWCNGRLTEADTLTIRLGATPSGLSSAHLHHPPIKMTLTTCYYYVIDRQGAVPTSGAKTAQQPSDAIQKAMEATLASIALPPPAASAAASSSAVTSTTSPVVAVSDR